MLMLVIQPGKPSLAWVRAGECRVFEKNASEEYIFFAP